MLNDTPARCITRPGTTWTSCPGECCEQMRKRQQKLHRCGRYRRPSSTAAWARVDALLSLGWSPAAIADVAGIRGASLGAAAGERRRTGARDLSPHNAGRILAIPADLPPTAATTGRVPATGSARRLQALAAIGWSLAAVEAQTGTSRLTGQRLRAGQTRYVTPAVARQVSDAYQALAYRPGPSASARTMAASRGWVPPMAWDDEQLDDPAAQPQGVLVRPARAIVHPAGVASPLRTDREDVEAAVLELTRAKLSARQIAERLGISDRSVVRVRSRAAVRQGQGDDLAVPA